MSENGPRTTTQRLSENSTFYFFWFKVNQTPLKSVHLSPFVPSVIFGMIPKSLKMVLRPPPSALVKTPLFLFDLGGGV